MIQQNTINNKEQGLCLYNFLSNDIWMPGEIFGYIVNFIPTFQLINSPLTLVCKAFYQNIHGPRGLFSYGVQCQERLSEDTLNIVTELNKVHPLTLDLLPLQEITQIFFKQIKPKDTQMLMHFFSTKILVEVFKEILKQKKFDGFIGIITSILNRTQCPLIVKINCFSFLLNIWESLSSLQVPKQTALTALSLLFFTSSKAQCGDFDSFFKIQNHLWLKNEDSPFPLQPLQNFQALAWDIICKTYNTNLDFTLQTPIAISAGLLCLSPENILPEKKTEALQLLLAMSSQAKAHSNVLNHIASTLILLDKHTKGGFNNIKDVEKAILTEIAENLKKKNTKTVQIKVAEIAKFIGKTNLKRDEPPFKKLKKDASEKKPEIEPRYQLCKRKLKDNLSPHEQPAIKKCKKDDSKEKTYNPKRPNEDPDHKGNPLYKKPKK